MAKWAPPVWRLLNETDSSLRSRLVAGAERRRSKTGSGWGARVLAAKGAWMCERAKITQL